MRTSERAREYGFLLVAGLLGTLFGIGNDLFTSWLSEEYFTLGKGLAAGAGFTGRVIWLAARAGFGAAAASAAIFLFMNSSRAGLTRLSYKRLFVLWWRPIACAILMASVLGTFVWRFAAPDNIPRFLSSIEPERSLRFLTVWSIHLGLYVGLFLGTVWSAATIFQTRRNERLPIE